MRKKEKNMVEEFKVINVMNEAKLQLLKEKNEDYGENLKIKNCLNDEAFFFKTGKENAQKILEKVGVKKEKIEDVYKKLIASDVFFDLVNKGKIDANDENLVVKYKVYRKQ
jgi:hypothetical protein